MNNIEGKKAVELGLKCMPLHASTTPSIFPCASFCLARSCLLLYQRCSLKAGTPSIFTDLKFLRLSPPQLAKNPSLCSPLHIHTYINTSLWRQRCRGRRGLGIKITLNSKQRIVGPWQVDGLSGSHTCFRITPL